MSLTHFMLLVSFFTRWKLKKTSGFFIFSESMKRDQWHEMLLRELSFTAVNLQNSFHLTVGCKRLFMGALNCFKIRALSWFWLCCSVDRHANHQFYFSWLSTPWSQDVNWTVCKTFWRCPELLLNVWCTFDLRRVSMGMRSYLIFSPFWKF